MRPEELEKTAVWQLYEIGRDYNRTKKIYSDTDKNYRMYNGNQWHGLIMKGIEPIQLNIIKPILRYKVGIINTNHYLPIFSADNFDSNEFKEIAVKTCELINNLVRKVWE